MKKEVRLVVWASLVATSLLTGGCATNEKDLAEVPIPTNFKTESMMQLQSVAHWNNVAIDMASGVAKKYGAANGCIPGFGCRTALYVKETAPETKFSKAFHTQLVSALVNQGLPVLTQTKPNVTTVDIDIQIVSSGGQAKLEYDQMPSELVEGVWVIRDLNDTAVHKLKDRSVGQWSNGDTNKSAWFKSPKQQPSAEMLVTVSFVNDGQYIARTSNMYYLNSVAGYVSQIDSPVVPAAIVPTQAAVSSTPQTGWNVRVVGDCTPERCYKK
jgi:hypothetical protein